MDTLSIAGSYASIVGLLANFAAGRSDARALEYQEFLRWLVENGYSQISARIEANHATAIGIKASLAEGRSELLEKLSSLESALAALSLGLGGVGQVASSISATLPLSEQAIALLVAFEKAEAARASVYATFESQEVVFLDGARKGHFVPSEQRFFNDDVHSLCKLGFLRSTHTGKGTLVLDITRAGSVLGRNVISAESRGDAL